MAAVRDRPRAPALDGPTIVDVVAGRQVRTEFQPIVDLESGRVVGYEALSRGPAGPFERPDALFAAARTAGLLAELDEVCRAVAVTSAIRAGIFAPLTLFVNVEPEVLGLTSTDTLLRIAAAAPQELHLVLEITERALATRPAELLATVRSLRAAGWRIALDDVGADNMSLAFMALLRPDIIKLDLQLVQRRPGPGVAEIMHAVNAHAERTGCLVLAEGIETTEHLQMARALGARLGQGWFFGRPVPSPRPDTVGPWVSAWAPAAAGSVPPAGRHPVLLPSAEPGAASHGQAAADRGQQAPGTAGRLGR